MKVTSVQESVIDTSTGFIIRKTQDCEPIFGAIKGASELQKKTVNTQHSQKYLGSVPVLLAVAWAKEWGVRPFSREWSKKAAHRLKTDPNWRKLRVGAGQ